MRHLLRAVVAVLVLTAPLARAAEPLMVYEGDGLTIHVLSMSEDEQTITGEVILGNGRWPFTGRSSVQGDVETVQGTFQVGNESHPFTATQGEDGKSLTFVADGKTYRLRERDAAATKPAPVPNVQPAPAVPNVPAIPKTSGAASGPMRFSTAQFRDVNMGNVVSHTMLIPHGFKPEGHIEWSNDRTPYPQTRIQVTAEDRSRIAFSPAQTYMYWEWTPQVRAQQEQSGMVLPDKQGEPPPSDLGAWLVATVRRVNQDVSNVVLVRDQRDQTSEAAMAESRRASGLNEVGTWEVHMIQFTFLLDGVPFTQEMNLTYSRLPQSETQNMVTWHWMLFTNSSVRAPTARWQVMRPILYAASSSLRTVPKWFTQSQLIIMEITRRNHEITMRDILARAAEYDKMSDANMAAWKKAQEISDKQQDERINMIYEVSNFTAPNGTVTKLPNGYAHYYVNSNGEFQMSNSNEPPKEAGWSPIEPTK